MMAALLEDIVLRVSSLCFLQCALVTSTHGGAGSLPASCALLSAGKHSS